MTKPTPLALLQRVAEALNKRSLAFAVAGGLCASFYRRSPRLTKDVDIALCADKADTTRSVAKAVIEELGFETALGWTVSNEKNASQINLVIGRIDSSDDAGTIDILLPSLPWVRLAIERAQHNKLDFEFSLLPALTPEDVIVSKAYALGCDPNRFQDMDDIREIFDGENRLDLLYIVERFEQLSLSLPKQLEALVPKPIQRASKAQRRK